MLRCHSGKGQYMSSTPPGRFDPGWACFAQLSKIIQDYACTAPFAGLTPSEGCPSWGADMMVYIVSVPTDSHPGAATKPALMPGLD